ncbi:helix-turn-helix domain-containing protein [Rhodococcus pyridinivorans]|uniref:AraC family transcriptional regulator n=1 Tax=Rhodococcus pyridinivorans TaxID=103816 RepID=UPI001E3436D2|nr:helix-turn-helix domain-containing protein [Rhodococcus pyridinivorans]MCD5418940.1 helix-turn-helix domain-containing protein [Rhodococcus pyridinivorans]
MTGSAVGESDGARRRPTPLLTPYVRSYEGYRLDGFPSGTHLGMPSPEVTVILTISEPVELSRGDGRRPERFDALAAGLSTQSVPIVHHGRQHGIQLALTPAGARALLGVPAAALGSWAVDLEDVIGADGRELFDRISAVESWDERFAVLDRILTRRLVAARSTSPDGHLVHAWHLLVTHPARPVRAVADELGWSRRHLANRCAAEFGLSPKDVARVARFDRSRGMLRADPGRRLADVAAECGFYDQAHLARDWRDLAGVPPSRWLEDEVFPFVQDDRGVPGRHSET